MKLIKLDAIDSTNDFLKGLSTKQIVENYTVITAENQTNGKGQMGAKWVSESGKNLTMSVLLKDFLLNINQIYLLNVAISLSVIAALEKYNIPKLTIKWPNDIMSDNKKIGGILIENSIKSENEIISVVGIGLNVNQMNFDSLPKASSLAVIMQTNFDKEELCIKIVDQIKTYILLLQKDQSTALWIKYKALLFKIGLPMPFQNQKGEQFMAIIQEVNDSGKLGLLLEDDSIQFFDIKEIQMLY